MARAYGLDAYARALAKFNLLGSDHRWRVEHLGAARRDQFDRAAALGVTCSMSPFQYIYWGDLLDGVMFDSAYGAQWQRIRDAFEAGVRPSYHNDGSVSPPNQLLNVQQTVTRKTINGSVHQVQDELTIGRSAGCHLTLDDTYVSQFHVRVTIGSDHRPVVEDLGSTNGTYLNRQRVSAPVIAGVGDRLQVGSTVFVVR